MQQGQEMKWGLAAPSPASLPGPPRLLPSPSLLVAFTQHMVTCYSCVFPVPVPPEPYWGGQPEEPVASVFLRGVGVP